MDLKSTLAKAFGPPCGLNADCSFQLWPLGDGLFLADREDDTFQVWRRVETENLVTWEDAGHPIPAEDLPAFVSVWTCNPRTL